MNWLQEQLKPLARAGELTSVGELSGEWGEVIVYLNNLPSHNEEVLKQAGEIQIQGSWQSLLCHLNQGWKGSNLGEVCSLKFESQDMYGS